MIVVSEDIIDQVHENPEYIRYCTDLKDTLRISTVDKMVQFWQAVLSAFSVSKPALTTLCLSTIRHYISWINIGFFVDSPFVPFFFQSLSVEAYSENAAGCIIKIVEKGTDPATKVSLIASLKLPQVLSSFSGASSSFIL